MTTNQNFTNYKKDILPVVDNTGSFQVDGEITADTFNGNFVGTFSGDGSELTNLPLPNLPDSFFSIDPDNFPGTGATAGDDENWIEYVSPSTAVDNTVIYHPGVTFAFDTYNTTVLSLSTGKNGAEGGTINSPTYGRDAEWVKADTDLIVYVTSPPSNTPGGHYFLTELWISSVDKPLISQTATAEGTLDLSQCSRISKFTGSQISSGGMFIVPKGVYYNIFSYTYPNSSFLPIRVKIMELNSSVLIEGITASLDNLNIQGSKSLFDFTPSNLVNATPGPDEWEQYTYLGNDYGVENYSGVTFGFTNTNDFSIPNGNGNQYKLAENDLYVIARINTNAERLKEIFVFISSDAQGSNAQILHQFRLVVESPTLNETFIIPRGVYYCIAARHNRNILQGTMSVTILPIKPTLETSDSLFTVNPNTLLANPPVPNTTEEDWTFFSYTPLASTVGSFYYSGITVTVSTAVSGIRPPPYTETQREWVNADTDILLITNRDSGYWFHTIVSIADPADIVGTAKRIFTHNGDVGSVGLPHLSGNYLSHSGIFIIPKGVTYSIDIIISTASGASTAPVDVYRYNLNTLPIQVRDGTPSGAVQAYARQTAPPGWVICNGGEYNKTHPDYVRLFTAIGTTFGETNGSGGAGSTHFRVPDMRGMFIRGFDGRAPNVGNDKTDGSSARGFGTTQAYNIQSHNHDTLGGIFAASGTGSGNVQGADFNQSAGPTTLTGGTETRPINVALLYCIKL